MFSPEGSGFSRKKEHPVPGVLFGLYMTGYAPGCGIIAKPDPCYGSCVVPNV